MLKAALSHQLSVIDGPPGTGKTQTILNLVATLVAQGKTVGIVSGVNSAVDNVVEKPPEEGYGFLGANVGKREKVEAFLREQGRLGELWEEWEATACFRMRRYFAYGSNEEARIRAALDAVEQDPFPPRFA